MIVIGLCKKIVKTYLKIKIFLITHNQQVNPIIEIIFYINANKIESVISYFDNCLWNMGIQKNLYHNSFNTNIASIAFTGYGSYK